MSRTIAARCWVNDPDGSAKSIVTPAGDSGSVGEPAPHAGPISRNEAATRSPRPRDAAVSADIRADVRPDNRTLSFPLPKNTFVIVTPTESMQLASISSSRDPHLAALFSAVSPRPSE